MSLKKIMKGVPSDPLAAEGLLSRDDEALTPCQMACIKTLGKTLQVEQENYLLQHPEVNAMLKMFMSKMVQKNKRKGILKEAAEYFTKNTDELKTEILENLTSKLQDDGERAKLPASSSLPTYNLTEVKEDIRALIASYYKPETKVSSEPSLSTLNTESSSFLSILTSDTTLSTPEPIPTPEPTLSETFYGFVSNTVDKAIFLRVDDQALNYDTAYIELMKAVEEAMEIPVTDIKLDIAELFENAYKMFEFDIMEKERIAAEIAWEKRMRKKMKRTLRRLNNFKGYETPTTPKSEISSHESYKIPPPRPCKCHPQFKYNRYPKDRFGIYLPTQKKYSDRNVTVTPDISEASDDERGDKTSTAS